ncbi:MAG: glycerol dehydratase [Rhodobacteraceae bacterium]|nr:MAG: glycerol dehydratase [Paracoccaceae bacterium]
MNRKNLTAADYPLAENRADLVRGRRGKTLADLTLAALERGEVQMEDLRITPAALTMQGDIARTEHRDKLAGNFDRAAELIDVPQAYLMQIYELLRPGRARDRSALQEVADTLRTTYNAPQMAAFIEEAGEVYHRRGLFKG